MIIKKFLAGIVFLALTPFSVNAATIDQSVFNHVTLISDIRNTSVSGQSFTAGLTGLLTGVDVRITTQDLLVGHINFYLGVFGSGFLNLAAPYVQIDASLIPEGGYVNDPTPASLLSIDTTPLNFYVEAGQEYSFFAVGVFTSDDVRALLELGCFDNTQYQCESPETTDSYEAGRRLSGWVQNPGDTNIEYYAAAGADANFQTWVAAEDVPAPATLWLVGLGLLASGFTKRRKAALVAH